MIYKIPIYIEVLIEGDFAPSDLNQAIDTIVAERINNVVREKGNFPFNSSTDMFDPLAERVRTACKAKEVRIKLIEKSHVLDKLSFNNRK
jgi:hypothetical protein